MDYTILHGINGFIVQHPLLASAAQLLATWIVPLVIAATIMPWLASGVGVDAGKLATSAALAGAALALLLNQVLAHVWDRPRPYADHASIVPLAGISSDPSFPSDHVSAAFAIAVGAYCFSRRAGRVLLVLAMVTAASRLLGAAHYPTDILGGMVVGSVSGFVAAKAVRLWIPLVRLVARLTDPVRLRIAAVPAFGRRIRDQRLRGRVVLLIGLAIGLRMAIGIGRHVLDEMPLLLLLGWAAAVHWIARQVSGETGGPARASGTPGPPAA